MSLGDCLTQAQAQERGRRDRSQDEGKAAEKSALQNATLADQIGKDRDTLQQNLNQPRTGADPEALLSRAYEPPKPLREPMQKLGISTNRDLWQKGEQVQRQLYDRAERLAGEAEQKYQTARQAETALKKFETMSAKVASNEQKMRSAPGTAKIASKEPSASDAKAPPASSAAAEGSSGVSRTAMSGMRASPSSSPQPAVAARSSPAQLQPTPETNPENSNAKAERRKSLAEKLRRAMAAGKWAEAESAKNELAKLDREEAAARAPASAEAAKADPVDPLLPFALAGSETDRAVGQLANQLAGADGTEDRDASLFERIHRPIRRCLKAGCLAKR